MGDRFERRLGASIFRAIREAQNERARELEHEMLLAEVRLIQEDQLILADMIGKFSHEEIDYVLSDDRHWGPPPRDPLHEEGKGRTHT